jgi:predicted metal-binding membrane protein
MSAGDRALAAVLTRDRLIVGLALAGLTALAWWYTLTVSVQMEAPPIPDMPGMDMSNMAAMALAPWTLTHALFVFAMWSVMMIGMMTPSLAPMVLIYAQVARQAGTLGKVFVPATWLGSGYLLAWTLFAALATAAQYALERAALLTPMLAGSDRWFGGALLIAAGAYQFAPLKDSCLASCRAPLSFVQRHGGFKADGIGSLALGFRHGLYCIGCCWALMALLFVGGVMNVLWIAGLMIFALAEKVVPAGRYLSRAAGLVAIAGGLYLFSQS